MAGPHGLWDGDRVSDAKRKRVTSGRTLADLAREVGHSVAQVHRVETTGHGSADLRRRIGQALGIVIPPARGNALLVGQLQLPRATSS